MAKARTYPKANRTAQWWEGSFSRGRFDRIEKILLHTTETTGWPGYKAGASAPTLTYHPRQRAWRQHNYLDTSARALVDPTGTTVRENRDNVIQIEIIAYSDERVAAQVGGLKVSQLTDDHYRDLAEFIAFIRREWGGPPLRAPKFIPYPTSYGNSSVRMSGPEYDAYQGIVGHMHASGNDHGDPSDIDAPKLLRFVQALEGATTPATEEISMSAADDIKAYIAALLVYGYDSKGKRQPSVVQRLAAQDGKLAALATAVDQVSKGEPIDMAAITKAAWDGSRAGVSEAIDSIDVTINKAQGA